IKSRLAELLDLAPPRMWEFSHKSATFLQTYRMRRCVDISPGILALMLKAEDVKSARARASSVQACTFLPTLLSFATPAVAVVILRKFFLSNTKERISPIF